MADSHQLSIEALFAELNSDARGLSSAEARRRLESCGRNRISGNRHFTTLRALARQFTSPIILILLGAAAISFFVGDRNDALIILFILVLSGLLGFWQENRAESSLSALLATIQTTVAVMRDSAKTNVPLEVIVPGDVVILSGGDCIPADCRLLESKDLFVDESSLTGESLPAEKAPGNAATDTPLLQRTNSLWLGTHVISGSGTALVVETGLHTQMGALTEHLKKNVRETDFERGVQRFGYLLAEITLFLVLIIFAANAYLGRPVLESFMFSLALAVGLTPQLLPAIISINLATGARRIAEEGAITRRLSSIENFGSMNVLCSDKTGTLTLGKMELVDALDFEGKHSPDVLLHACLNATFETCFSNPIDEAIRRSHPIDVNAYKKLDEVPYDFARRRLSVLVSSPGGNLLICKGALPKILEVCDSTESNGQRVPLEPLRASILAKFDTLSARGLRVIGVAKKNTTQNTIGRNDEINLVFLGMITFADPPKPRISDTLESIKKLGIGLKIITGDNARVASSIAEQVGLKDRTIVTGRELSGMTDSALARRAFHVDIFAEIEPNQKERIVLALRKAGKVVGYIGDGINDAPALHAADVGISVDSAVDIAKETADIVLLKKDLNVLVSAIQEGRRTFANTLKYVFMATSANFGNMFSMAGASLFLPFLPLIPKQIMLMNLLTDFPEMNIATDKVDAELIRRPQRWDLRMIQRFMITFGLLSSAFDFATFYVLLKILKADEPQFRTGWFVESVVSAIFVVLVIRTRKPFFASMPGRGLFVATLASLAITVYVPYSPIGKMLGFVPLKLEFILSLLLLISVYVLSAELIKWRFYKLRDRRSSRLTTLHNEEKPLASG